MALARIGIPNVAVHNRSSSFKGKPYELEELRLTSFQNVMIFASRVTLLYPNKAKRLREQVEYIQTVQSHIPTWKQVALWLKEEPRTWEEVAERFNLTKKQFDSVMQNIKRVMEVEVIPPPKSLTRYRVKDPSSSQEP
jgi:prephenate dehydratase